MKKYNQNTAHNQPQKFPNRINIQETKENDKRRNSQKPSLRSSKLAPEYRLNYNENENLSDHIDPVNP